MCLPTLSFDTALARAVASTILCPVTVIKTRMEYTGSGAIRQVPQAEEYALPMGCEQTNPLFASQVSKAGSRPVRSAAALI